MKISGVSNSTGVNNRIVAEHAGKSTLSEEPFAGRALLHSRNRHKRPLPAFAGEEAEQRKNPGFAVNSTLDGIVLLETADEALLRLLELLQELGELARQAAEEAGNDADRLALDKAAHRQLQQMDKLVSATRFKGKQLLRGDLGCAFFQVGNDSDALLCLNLGASVHCSTIGAIATASTTALAPLIDNAKAKGAYTTPAIRDLNFFTATRHANLIIDGISVGLYRDWTGAGEAAAAALEQDLNTAWGRAHYRVNYALHQFTITANSGPAPSITAASVRGVEFLGGVTVGVSTPRELNFSLGDFSIAVGASPAVDIVGSYHTPEELAAAIERAIPGLHAALNSNGALELAAQETITIAGTKASEPLEFGFSHQPHEPDGNLSMISLCNADACRHARLRIDSARDSINSLLIRIAETKRRFHQATSFRRNPAETQSGPRLYLTTIESAKAQATQTCAKFQNNPSQSLIAQAGIPAATTRMLLHGEPSSSELSFCLVRCPHDEQGCC